ncbi:MAG: hypothetical protein J2P29_15420, partial [Actinobacteria bacterium]|nr:hypothetical protein [Actinomycetota bacterium]
SGLASQVFTHGFVEALRPSIIAPILFLFAGAICCVFIKPQQPARDGMAREATEPTTIGAD